MTVTTEYQYAASAGTFATASRVATLGNNPSIDTATQPEDVWAGASLGVLNAIDHRFIPKPQAAVAMEVVSDSVNDTSAGTGARTVIVGYLDSTYATVTTTITLNGTTAVALPTNAIRINTFVVATVGTYGGNNLGNISIRAAGGAGATYAYMPIGAGIHRTSLYTVPTGFSYDQVSLFICINRTDTVDRYGKFSLCIQNQAGRLIKGLILSVGTAAPYRHEADGMPVNTFAAGTDVWLRCEAVNNNNTDVTGGYVGIQRTNPPLYG